MTRTHLIVALLLIILGLFLGGDYLVARTLNAQLAPLLTREIGIPVSLAPIDVRLAKLRARSPKLVMGDPADPAVVAKDIEVTISLSQLLKGEVRLVTAHASDLMVNIWRWPSSDGPLPQDYQFLEQWLPQRLGFDQGRYINQDNSPYELRDFEWQRQEQGSVLAHWFEDRPSGELGIDVTLPSLDDLLNLAPLQAQGSAALTGKPQSTVNISGSIKPADGSGYIVDGVVSAAGMTASINATNSDNWALPSHSKTSIETIQVEKLRALLDSYSGYLGKDPQDPLETPLPALNLGEHQGSVAIAEIRMGDELGEATSFDYVAGADGLHITALTSKGPAGVLTGYFDIDNTGSGWKVDLQAAMSARHDNKSIAAKYMDADWLWETGHAHLKGQGASWGELLFALAGEIRLEGLHRGDDRTPITLEARLENSPGEFALNHMEVTLGEGSMTGGMRLTNETRHKLTLVATARQLDLDFLFEEPSEDAAPGIAIPEYLGLLPGIDLDWKLDINGLSAPAMQLSQAKLTCSAVRPADAWK